MVVDGQNRLRGRGGNARGRAPVNWPPRKRVSSVSHAHHQVESHLPFRRNSVPIFLICVSSSPAISPGQSIRNHSLAPDVARFCNPLL